MSPDEALEELRMLYNEIVDNGGEPGVVAAAGERMADVFDGLDNSIIAGGPLPREWTRK